MRLRLCEDCTSTSSHPAAGLCRCRAYSTLLQAAMGRNSRSMPRATFASLVSTSGRAHSPPAAVGPALAVNAVCFGLPTCSSRGTPKQPSSRMMDPMLHGSRTPHAITRSVAESVRAASAAASSMDAPTGFRFSVCVMLFAPRFDCVAVGANWRLVTYR